MFLIKLDGAPVTADLFLDCMIWQNEINVLHCLTLNSHVMETTLSVRIDKNLKDQLQRYSEKTGISSSIIVREALKKQLQIATFRELRNDLIPYAEREGLLTDDDIFNSVS